MHGVALPANSSFGVGKQARCTSRKFVWPLTRWRILATLSRMPRLHLLKRRHTVAFTALVVGLSFGVLHARDASSEPSVIDGAPSGMVAFVRGGVCPPGWVPATDLEGRAVVGTVTKEDVGIDVGDPLGDGEVPAHHHDYTVDVNLPAKFLLAANAGEPVTGAGLYSITDVTDESDTELPFFQMEACIKP